MTVESKIEDETVPRIDSPLRLFRGTFVPGVSFTSGYCVWVFDFTSCPAEVDPFIDVWIVTPDGERILYVDPDEATDDVLYYHEFDRTVGAHITREQTTGGRARVTLDADDGTNFKLTLTFNQTIGTRILNAVSALTPRAMSRSRYGGIAATSALNRLVEANGLKVHGRTDNNAPYQFEAERLYVVSDASATLNGEDIGELARTPRSIAFGDIRNAPLYIQGKAYLPVPEPRSEASSEPNPPE